MTRSEVFFFFKKFFIGLAHVTIICMYFNNFQYSNAIFINLVMGVGFNSIYHITDSPSFITNDKYVILDPHEWYFNGGVQFDFVDEELARDYPDQFAPFGVSCDRPLKGTVFRYPLRTKEDSIDSD